MVSKTIYGAVAVIAAIIISVAAAASIDNEPILIGTPLPSTTTPSTEIPVEKLGTTLDVIDDDDVIIEDKMTSDLPDVVDVGVMTLDTGCLAEYCLKYNYAITLGFVDFNAYLEEIDASWRFSYRLDDSRYDPIIALEKIQSLNSDGVKFVLGPLTSPEISNIKSYVDSNNMVLISPSSTSTSLAISDNIFRIVPDDNQYSKVLDLLFQEQGINVVIPIYHDGVWANKMYASVKSNFESLGGVMDEGIHYSTEDREYSEEAELLSNLVIEYTNEYSTDEVAVLIIGFSDTMHILNSAAQYDNLREIRWFGSYGSSRDLDGGLVDVPTTSEFTQDINFVSVQLATSTNDIYTHVKNYADDNFSQQTGISIYSLYDSVFVLGKTMLATNSADPVTVRDALIGVAATHTGTMGTINLNEFGDLAASDYELWAIRDGQWVEYGRFNSESGTFDYYMTDKG